MCWQESIFLFFNKAYKAKVREYKYVLTSATVGNERMFSGWDGGLVVNDKESYVVYTRRNKDKKWEDDKESKRRWGNVVMKEKV